MSPDGLFSSWKARFQDAGSLPSTFAYPNPLRTITGFVPPFACNVESDRYTRRLARRKNGWVGRLRRLKWRIKFSANATEPNVCAVIKMAAVLKNKKAQQKKKGAVWL
jgi:hypothetical protein